MLGKGYPATGIHIDFTEKLKDSDGKGEGHPEGGGGRL